jgi:hypothetical protein
MANSRVPEIATIAIIAIKDIRQESRAAEHNIRPDLG